MVLVLNIRHADTLHSHYIIIVLFSEHVAPPKKPPRPGAPAHLASLCPVDSYNEGVKVFLNIFFFPIPFLFDYCH